MFLDYKEKCNTCNSMWISKTNFHCYHCKLNVQLSLIGAICTPCKKLALLLLIFLFRSDFLAGYDDKDRSLIITLWMIIEKIFQTRHTNVKDF